MSITTIGLDIAKNVFQIHGVDANGKVALRKQLKRVQVLAFFANLSPCLIGLEACGGAHYWARELLKLGHDARLISPQFVKPYVKDNKNDANDAEAICEAVGRPSMRFVPLKSIEQQDIQMLHRVRSGLVKERTAQANRLRGLLSEYGIVIGKGLAQLRKRLPELLEDGDNGLTMAARQIFADRQQQLIELDIQVSTYGEKILMLHRSSAVSKTLGTIPGLGRSPPQRCWLRWAMARPLTRRGKCQPGWAWFPSKIPAAASRSCWVSASAATPIYEPC